MKKKQSKKSKKKYSPEYKNVEDVRCPVCNGVINYKWFNFRTKNIVEFIAECWSGDTNTEEPYPKHIFAFQIETPEIALIYGKRSKAFRNDD